MTNVDAAPGFYFQQSLPGRRPSRRTGVTPAARRSRQRRRWPGFTTAGRRSCRPIPFARPRHQRETQSRKCPIHDGHDDHDDRRRPHAARSYDRSFHVGRQSLLPSEEAQAACACTIGAMFGELSTGVWPCAHQSARRLATDAITQKAVSVGGRQSALVGDESSEGERGRAGYTMRASLTIPGRAGRRSGPPRSTQALRLHQTLGI